MARKPTKFEVKIRALARAYTDAMTIDDQCAAIGALADCIMTESFQDGWNSVFYAFNQPRALTEEGNMPIMQFLRHRRCDPFSLVGMNRAIQDWSDEDSESLYDSMMED